MPTDSINPNEIQDSELARQPEHQNKRNGLQIMGMKLLRRKLKNNLCHFSLMIFFTSPDMATNPSNMESTSTNSSSPWRNTLSNFSWFNATNVSSSDIMS